ncbi:hypothetical protein [Methylobacterium trifolii]|uniref:Uncharacterized protein n=1 Tax=Methylobacterium trifolii TaxID=1003092 RepID=A0ABQ4U055_9HYPH|nr:hypothetical protein [Methylobacterium trifolii]GJE60156.1 hypothetical protein MPOCJGCO_2266 [Methylobacterium trifolii]
MTRLAWLALVLVSGPALASPCSDRIDALSKRVKAESTEAISASTGGQSTAGRRGGEGVTGTQGQSGAPQAPPEKSAEAGKGGDTAQQAKVALDEARTADGKGDATACTAAVERAEQQLKAAP